MDSVTSFKLLHCCDYIDSFKSNNDINKLCIDLARFLSIDIEHYFFKPIDESEVELIARRFLSNLVSLRNIPYLGKNINVKDNSVISSFKSYLFSSNINPYQLPINFKEDSDNCVKISTYYDSILNRLYYRSIDLRSKIDITSVASYIHEIIHTQLEHTTTVKEFYNGEVLSIFFELIFCLSLDNGGPLSYDMIINRLADLIRSNDKLNSDKNKNSVYNGRYVNSIIKAFNLVDIYYELDSIGRDKMMLDIQNIFDKKVSLEEFLSKYNVSLDNGITSIRRLILS